MRYVRPLALAAVATSVGTTACVAGRRGDMTSVLMRIEPDTRLEQVCDVEAMHRIARIKPFKPDRAKSDVTSHPKHDGHAMTARGAAFRSAGTWYAFSFECTGSPDHTRVLSLSFKIGDEIPQSRWSDLGLWR